MSTSPVVVGVDGSADARSAVLWAAAEATLAQTSLLVVHSPRLPAAEIRSGHLSTALRASDDVGQTVLNSAIALARASQPDAVVKGLLSHADPAQALIDLSAEAQLLVLGSRSAAMGDMSLLSKRVTVSAHAHCAVLLLGPVSAFSPPSAVSRIVVGAASTRAGRAAVDFAIAEAVRRQIPLHLLRLERPVPAAAPLPRKESIHQAENELTAQVASVGNEHPDLAVVADVARGEAAEILPSYSDGSTILVVGCHHSDDHWSTRLGPVATSVVHRNRGAVVVVGYARDYQTRPETALAGYRLGPAHR